MSPALMSRFQNVLNNCGVESLQGIRPHWRLIYCFSSRCISASEKFRNQLRWREVLHLHVHLHNSLLPPLSPVPLHADDGGASPYPCTWTSSANRTDVKQKISFAAVPKTTPSMPKVTLRNSRPTTAPTTTYDRSWKPSKGTIPTRIFALSEKPCMTD